MRLTSPIAHTKLSTKRRGRIGELLTEVDLLKRDLLIMTPIVDDKNIDYAVIDQGKTYTIQVKYHRSSTTSTAISIKVKPCIADIIAIPFTNGGLYQVFYVWNRNKDRCWNMNISISQPKNNQSKGIHFGKDYREFPPC